MARFDKFMAEKNAVAPTNGHTEAVKAESSESPETTQQLSARPSKSHSKRETDDDDDLSDLPSEPSPKKKRKVEHFVDEDAAFAAKLQAEENSRARPTRGGVNKKGALMKKKKKTPKKKTSAKVKTEDDSDVDDSGSGSAEKKVNRSGGFHVRLKTTFEAFGMLLKQQQKPYTLSTPLSIMLDGEIQLSRPQTVKRIWEYVRAHDLQDPNDKRIIRCDDTMRAVFKQEKVHIFTMNKLLGQSLYSVDE